MKSDLKGPKKQKEQKQKYPYLGIHKRLGMVVLFTEKETGVVVHSAKDVRPLGYVTGYKRNDRGLPCWAEKDFEPLKGKITLEND